MAKVRINAVVILLVFSNLACAFGLVRKAGPPPAVFNVLQFGAKPNTPDDVCAEAFVKAWQAACHHPGGNAKVVIPPGNYKLYPVIFQGPCTGAEIVVEVQGTLTGSDDVSDYEEGQWILFENVNGLVLTGGGTLDGNGGKTWKYNDCRSNPDCTPLAAGLKFSNVKKGNVGPLKTLNPQGVHIILDRCDGIQFHDVNINAPKTSPNTDGFHVGASHNIGISGSVIATGGACIAVGEGSTGVTVAPSVTCGTKKCVNPQVCINDKIQMH